MPVVIRIGSIKSLTRQDREYGIFQDGHDARKLSCNCPRWTKARHLLPEGRCKHILQFIRENPDLLPLSFAHRTEKPFQMTADFESLGNWMGHLKRING